MATRINLAAAFKAAGRLADVPPLYDELLRQVNAKLGPDHPDTLATMQELAASHINLGAHFRDQGQGPEAAAEYRAALVIREKMAADFPAVPAHRYSLAQNYHDLGFLLDRRVAQVAPGQRAEAEAAFRTALSLLEKLAADSPTSIPYRTALARSHYDLGNLLKGLGRPAEADAHHRQALAIREELAAQSPNAGASQFTLAMSLAAVGDHARATAKVEELTRGDNISGGSFYNAACVYTLSSAAVKDDDRRQESYAAQAVALLRRAQAAGYFKNVSNVELLKTDSDLDALRRRNDFADLLWDLADLPPGRQPGA
jgi:tetratricopeptide (TPR) repeat protein